MKQTYIHRDHTSATLISAKDKLKKKKEAGILIKSLRAWLLIFFFFNQRRFKQKEAYGIA